MHPTQAEQLGSPRVTALIVTRNNAQQLQRCLQALEHTQARESLEVLVVDNGSGDGTPEIIAAFPDVQSLRLPKDFGRTKASNIGMRTAKGDFLFLLPEHVEVQPDTIALLGHRLAESEAVGAVHPYVAGWYRLPMPDDLASACGTGALPNPQSTPENVDELAVEYAPDSPVMMRRTFLRGMNYFDERFGDLWADLDVGWQLRNAGKTILILPQVKVTYNSPPASGNDTVHKSDCIVGAATYVSKHFGTGAGIKFRLSAMLRALGSGDFSLLSALLSGQKVDGTHL